MEFMSKEKGNRVSGKVKIVTGAGSSAEGIGNGRAVAILLARHGAKVGLLDYNEAAAAETARMIEDEGGECIVIQADVSDVEACQSAVRTAVDRWGRLDTLVNNVGTSRVVGNAGAGCLQGSRRHLLESESSYASPSFHAA